MDVVVVVPRRGRGPDETGDDGDDDRLHRGRGGAEEGSGGWDVGKSQHATTRVFMSFRTQYSFTLWYRTCSWGVARHR
jgi:hypothetical protein